MGKKKNAASNGTAVAQAPPPASNPQETGKRERPVMEFRYGRIKATIWKNTDAQSGEEWFSVTFSRSYKVSGPNGDTWKSAHSFGGLDCLVVAELAREAFRFCSEQPRKDNGASRDAVPPTSAAHEGETPNGNEDGIPF